MSWSEPDDERWDDLDGGGPEGGVDGRRWPLT
jgi:hypothetical protein